MSEPWRNFRYPSKKVSWVKRDVLLFALSVGVKADDIHLLFVRISRQSHGAAWLQALNNFPQESHPNFQVLPSYAIVLCTE